LSLRAINSNNEQLAKSLRETAGIKSWTTAELDHFLARLRFTVWPKCCDNPIGIIAKKFFTAENVQPRHVFK
jgi:hypothetical protein